MNVVTVDNFVRLIRWHGWIPLLSLVVAVFIRLSKNDAKVTWFPNYIKPENRPIWALGVSLLGGIIEQAFAGGTALEALVGGIIAANTAIAGHEITSKVGQKIRDKRSKSNPPPPSAPMMDWDDDSQRPPVPPNVPPPPGPIQILIAVATVFAFAACAYRQTVCQAIDLASQACPLILVKLPDGSQEYVTRDRVSDLAMRARLSRIAAEAEMQREATLVDQWHEEQIRRMMQLDGGVE